MEHTAPSIDAQHVDGELRSLFATLLDIDPSEIGDDNDFFELGGDSLMVIKLVARIRRKLNTELTPGDVFDHPTVAALSTFLKANTQLS
ncbi:acyl carrier protein [Paraburkholderia sp.]|uniref:acyl carrier protein n=1 Tax=Paraburkholderia sp. TaxID=1926495 RepID=UPI00238C1459|nr:acyl carrier protein [Paraburkholderia sp.]MDE1182641.1 acyl carrier protein [Paraburkholderia sp.]